MKYAGRAQQRIMAGMSAKLAQAAYGPGLALARGMLAPLAWVAMPDAAPAAADSDAPAAPAQAGGHPRHEP